MHESLLTHSVHYMCERDSVVAVLKSITGCKALSAVHPSLSQE